MEQAVFDSSKEERDLYLEKLAIKRKSNLNSIKEIFIPKEHFCTSIQLHENAIEEASFSSEKKKQLYYSLGMSIGNLLKMEMSSLVFVRSCCQLFEEAFAFNSSLLDFLMDAMPSSGAVCKTDGVSYVESVEKNVKFHPVIQKHGKEIVYQVLRMPEMKFELSFAQVVASLADVLILMYARLYDEELSDNPYGFYSIRKLDAVVVEKLLHKWMKDMTILGIKVMENELGRYRKYT